MLPSSPYLLTLPRLPSAAFRHFAARASGLDGTHVAAYRALLDGLTADGLFNSDGTSNYLEVLQIYATQDVTNAALNLVSSSFSSTVTGGPTFTADRGFTGTGFTNAYVDTGYNPNGSSLYTQNSAHFSAWNLENAANNGPLVNILSGASGENLYPKFSDNNTYIRVNDNPEASGFAITSPLGHFLGNRDGATSRQGYQNATSVGAFGSVTSQAVLNSNFIVAGNVGGGVSTRQAAMFSAGASLTSGLVTSFYNRLRAYMTAVGVP